MNFRTQATDAQLAISDYISNEYLINNIKEKGQLVFRAISAIVSLPAKNERGESVIHLCNLEMMGIRDYAFDSFKKDSDILRYRIPYNEYAELMDSFGFEWGKGTSYPVLKKEEKQK